MSVASWAAGHRRSILFLLAILALGGAASALRLPVALFPHVNFPRIVVTVNAGDRPGEQMVVSVTRPVEQAVRSVPGVREIRSTTSRGSAELSVNFDWGTNMSLALQQVDSAVNQTLPQLPKGTSFEARRMDPTVFPVAAYSLISDKEDQVQLRDIAKYQLVPLFSAINGVAHVSVLGGEQAEYRVDVDPAQLRAYGLTLHDVVKALSAANVLQAVGRLQDHYKLYLMLSDTRLKGLDQIRHTVLASGNNGLVELEDIATVRKATVPKWMSVTSNGHQAVSLQIYQQPGGNTVQIVRDVKAQLAAYRGKLPKDLKISNWYDQSRLILASAASVRDAILIGVLLAALVLLAFLRSVKVTLVAILVVPAVLAATVLLLYVLNMSFNIMTLGGMAAAVGLIIDDAIVMIENIVRHLRRPADGEGGSAAHHTRIREAAREFVHPLTGSSASTIIIFVPLAFLGGVTGAFFKALSLTMASALIISYLVAWLAIPLLADHLLSEADAAREDEGPLTRRLHAAYRRLMAATLRRPLWLLVGVVPFLALGYLAYQHVGSGFMPKMDEGGFVLDYQAAPGTSLRETDRLLRQVEAILEKTPEVASYSRRTGAQLGGGITEAREGDFFVRLKPPPRRSVEAIMDSLRDKIHRQVPGLDIDMAQLMEDLIGDLTAVPQPIEIKLYGDDTKALLHTAPKVAAAIAHIKGVVDVRDGIVQAGDALDVKVDRAKAALEGVDPEAVTRQLKAYFSGVVTTHVQRGVKVIGIRVWVPKTLRRNIDQIGGVRLQAPDGHVFPLRRIAHIVTLHGQPQITRDNLKRMVAVTARISGRDLGSTVRDVRKVINKPGLIPKQLYFRLGGLYKQQQIAFHGLAAVMIAAVALVFLLLLFLYERFRVALAIMTAPLLALAGVFIALWASGIELNITAMMGMTMVVGIVTEVAIFYFSEYHELTRDGADGFAALADAGVNRMRPIAMTTLAAILALAPLALGIGQGSAMQQPLAVAIIAGLLIQMPLVLILMPVVFAALNRLRPPA
ncbi:MAG TPA: efflux RND transporter permease subunit [Gammaproteobacteria bacterium]|nr:efflux RND transporter permease subunit [Gammaproteobacteria bacterium]